VEFEKEIIDSILNDFPNYVSLSYLPECSQSANVIKILASVRARFINESLVISKVNIRTNWKLWDQLLQDETQEFTVPMLIFKYQGKVTNYLIRHIFIKTVCIKSNKIRFLIGLAKY
jgi:hypothetical protein